MPIYRSERTVRYNVSAILQSSSPADLHRVVSYLKSRVPSFEVLRHDSLGRLQRVALVCHKRELAGSLGYCEPTGARVICVQAPVSVKRIEDEIRRAA